jgi:hypothetical protein
MGRRENLAAGASQLTLGRDTARRAPPRDCAREDRRNARHFLSTAP